MLFRSDEVDQAVAAAHVVDRDDVRMGQPGGGLRLPGEPLPDLLLEAMGWREGTVLDIDIVGNRLVLREVVPSDTSEDLLVG